MALNLPTGQRGQAVAAGILGISLLVFWAVAMSPLLDWYGRRADAIDSLATRLAHEQALIKSLPQLRQAAQEASAHPARSLLNGTTDAIAGAALQEQIQSMAQASAVSLTSVETLPAEQVGAYRRISVHVELNATLQVIVALMRAVEDAEPTMLIDDIHFTAAPTNAAVSLPMDASFTVIAFRQGTAPREETKAVTQ